MADNSIQESWNMATATLKRLNNLLIQSSIFAQAGDLKSWYKVIMDLRRNLRTFMEKTDFDIVEDKLKLLPEKWNSYNKIKSDDYSIINKTFDEVYMMFMDTMKSKGLLMPKATDVNRAIIGG